MRYLIKGILHSDDEPDREFSWAVNSEEEKEKALAELEQSDCEEVTEILEITLEDCIEQEFNIMIDNARKDYLIRSCLHLSDEEYFAKKQELLEDGELFLTALKEFNKKELLMRRMKRKNVKRDHLIESGYKRVHALVKRYSGHNENLLERSFVKEG